MRVTRRHASLVLVALTVVLAGCGGGGGGTATPADRTDSGNDPLVDETDTPVPDGDTPGTPGTATPGAGTPGESPAEPDEPTSSATPTATGTPTPSGSTPTPTATPEPDVMTQFREASQSQGGFRANFSWGMTDSGEQWVNRTGYRIYDLEKLEAYQWRTLYFNYPGAPTTKIETYVPPGAETAYACDINNGVCTTRIQPDKDFNETVGYVTPFGTVTNLSAAPNFTDAGTVQTDEGPRERYVVTDISQLPEPEVDLEYLAVDSEMLVDPDTDLITKIVWDVRIRNVQGNVVRIHRVITYEWLESVDVPVPDWYGGESS